MGGSYWSEVKIEVPAELGEVIAEIFQEEGAGGVVFDDPAILAERPFQDDEYLGEEIKSAVPERFALRAYFPVDDRLGEKLARFKERVHEVLNYLPELELKQVQEEDWAEAWKTYFKPERIGRVVIKPSWEEYHPVKNEIIVELDPGMAFGTGTHPTTRLCLQLLQETVSGPLSILDVGTGSGILAVTAVKLGAARVMATDIDPLAVRTATENAIRNRVADRIKAVEGNLLEIKLTETYDLVVANIIANAILEIIPGLPKVLKANGLFVASGIINERYPEVRAKLEQLGFSIIKLRTEDGWSALVAQKSPES